MCRVCVLLFDDIQTYTLKPAAARGATPPRSAPRTQGTHNQYMLVARCTALLCCCCVCMVCLCDTNPQTASNWHTAQPGKGICRDAIACTGLAGRPQHPHRWLASCKLLCQTGSNDWARDFQMAPPTRAAHSLIARSLARLTRDHREIPREMIARSLSGARARDVLEAAALAVVAAARRAEELARHRQPRA